MSITVDDTFNVNDADKRANNLYELCDTCELDEFRDIEDLLDEDEIASFEHKIGRWGQHPKYEHKIERENGEDEVINDPLKIKHYIKYGEECPICLEGITSRKNSFLTDCGHSFHKSCIMKHKLHNFNGIDCPVCRSDVNTDSPFSFGINRGDASSWNGINNIIMKNELIPHMCYERIGWYGYPHITGTNKLNCFQCCNYIETGYRFLDCGLRI